MFQFPLPIFFDVNYLTLDEKDQLQQRLSEIVKIGQLLKLNSLADWLELVSRYSVETGEPIQAKFHTDQHQSVTGIYYVLPDRKVDVDRESPSPLDEAIIHLAAQSQVKGNDGKGFNLDDWEWGVNLAQRLEQGDKMSLDEAVAAHSRIGKYRRQLAKVDLMVPPIESIAYHYDPSQNPMVIVEGASLDFPLDHPKHLQAALQKKPELSEVSQRLFDCGLLLEKIARHFRSSNSGLDGFDLLQAGTAIVGAGFVVLGRLNEAFRRIEAQKLLKDPNLGDAAGQINLITQDLDIQFVPAQDILSARGGELTPIPEPLFSETPEIRFVQWVDLVDSHQRSLIEALDETRQVKPIKLLKGADVKDDIYRCQQNQQQLNQLIARGLAEEQPIKMLGGAISPENFYQKCLGFFQANEAANDWTFYPHLNYEVSNDQGLKLTWQQGQIQVESQGNLILSITKQGGYQIIDKSDALTITHLASLPTTPEDIKQKSLENKLFNCLKAHPYYQRGSGSIKVLGLGTFKFQENPPQNGCLIRGLSDNNQEFWRSDQRVQKNTLHPKILTQLADKLARPTRNKTVSPNLTKDSNHENYLSM